MLYMNDTAAGPVHLPYRPALDGLRGLAVVLVVTFHLGFSWAKGGYLGVSVFFTLSGFLIMSLLIVEHRREGRIDLRRFWCRRARRLLPAALAGLMLAAIVSRAMAGATEGANLDLLSALGDVANWRFLAAGRSYGALFTSPSPVLHYWSLSIEEQFYAIFPLATALVLWRARRRTALLRVCSIGVGLSWAALAISAIIGAHDFAYFSTLTRAGEFLTGAVAALLVHRGGASHAARPSTRLRSLLMVLEPTALGGLLVLSATIAQSSTALERGLLPAVSLSSAVVVVACFRGGGVARILSCRPLVGLGRISYGIYVYHWPIFLLLTPRRTGLAGIELVSVRVAATLALSLFSYFALELPIRTGSWPRRVRATRLAPAAFAIVALAITPLVGISRPTIDFVAASAAIGASARSLSDARSAPASPDSLPGSQFGPQANGLPTGRPTRVAVFGDSTALMMTAGLARWGDLTGRLQISVGYTQLGCSLLQGARKFQGKAHETNVPNCQRWPEQWAAQLDANPTDVAVILMGPWDVTDHRLPGDAQWRHVGDPVLDEALRAQMRLAVHIMLQRVKRVVWLTSPDVRNDLALPDRPARGYPENDPARMKRYNELVSQVASEVPAVAVVDLNGHLRSLPGGEMDPSLRPDGVHFSNESTDIVAPWISDAILRAAA